jgi:type II secretory pathway pseudopilin PulG
MRAVRKTSGVQAQGLVLLALLLFVALSSVWVALAAEVWATARQRERETELLFVGEQYRHAIESYWRASPGRAKAFPNSLEVLLTDDRFPMPVHHLRRLYADPITGGEFGLVREGSAIVGVYPDSKDAPRKVASFPVRYQHFTGAESYDQWRFVFMPPRGSTTVNRPRAPSPGQIKDLQ